MDLFQDLKFDDADLPSDTTPVTADVECPCTVCGRESGPYSGRGRKPVKCAEHRATRSPSNGVRVTGNASNLAAQAAKTLVQLNHAIALGAAALSMFATSKTIFSYQETFEQQAYTALLTDPEFCKQLLRAGSKSSKASLFLCYAGMGVAVAPIAVAEIKEKRAAKQAEAEEV
jgi:hypothetical protein